MNRRWSSRARNHATGIGWPAAGVLLASCAGALFGLAYTPPEKWGKLLDVPNGEPWRRYTVIFFRACGLLFTLTAIAFASGWAVAVVPYMPGLTWAQAVPAIPAAGLLSFAGQYVVPRSLAAAGRWLDNRGKT